MDFWNIFNFFAKLNQLGFSGGGRAWLWPQSCVVLSCSLVEPIPVYPGGRRGNNSCPARKNCHDFIQPHPCCMEWRANRVTPCQAEVVAVFVCGRELLPSFCFVFASSTEPLCTQAVAVAIILARTQKMPRGPPGREWRASRTTPCERKLVAFFAWVPELWGRFNWRAPQ